MEINECADALARCASAMDFELIRLIPAELLNEPSTNAPKQVMTIQPDNS